jgi:methylmalonyl-CoA mutase N-terminal domain/subunit
VRVALQALAAVLGGTQSLHTNSRDEALGLPTEDSARLALRTQQVIAFESGVTGTVDPLGGAPFVEHLTDALEARASAYIAEIDRLGGSVAAIEAGYVQREIMQAAYAWQRAVESGELCVVGVNRFQDGGEAEPPAFRLDEEAAAGRAARIARLRKDRPPAAADEALSGLESAARGKQNLMPRMLACVEAGVTIGEICTALERVFGRHREVSVL